MAHTSNDVSGRSGRENSGAEDEVLDKPVINSGRMYQWFDNPWEKTWRRPSRKDILKIKRLMEPDRFPPEGIKQKLLPLHTWGESTPDEVLNPPEDKIQATWVGHATVLVQMDGINILTDPIFSDYCSLIPIKDFKRYQPVPCQIKDLPKIHAVVISHNHYDHLDKRSVQDLNSKNKDIKWYVPQEMKSLMKSWGCGFVEELTWWEEKISKFEGDKSFKFVLTPAQHWSQRGLFDSMKMLWGSWCVIGPKHKFYFAGDTGYCSTFVQIGKKYGPFDLAAIPIGAYQPREYLKYQHVNPEEAVQIHKDINAKQSIAIHWGTFPLGGESYLQPKSDLKECLFKAENKDFKIVEHGKPVVFPNEKDDNNQNDKENNANDQTDIKGITEDKSDLNKYGTGNTENEQAVLQDKSDTIQNDAVNTENDQIGYIQKVPQENGKDDQNGKRNTENDQKANTQEDASQDESGMNQMITENTENDQTKNKQEDVPQEKSDTNGTENTDDDQTKNKQEDVSQEKSDTNGTENTDDDQTKNKQEDVPQEKSDTNDTENTDDDQTKNKQEDVPQEKSGTNGTENTDNDQTKNKQEDVPQEKSDTNQNDTENTDNEQNIPQKE